MDKKLMNVLIIENQPLIIDIYKKALLSCNSNNLIEFNFEIIINRKDVIKKLNKKRRAFWYFDLIIFDICLGDSKSHKVECFEDLAIKIKETIPNVKFLILTNDNCSYAIMNLINTVAPHSILIKKEVDYVYLKAAINSVMNDEPYYSKTVKEILKEDKLKNLDLDHIDLRLLYELSIGTRTKDLPQVLALSLSSIEYRKRMLRKIFKGLVPETNCLLQAARYLELI